MLAESDFAAVAVLIVERFDVACTVLDLPIDTIRQARIVAAVTKFRDDVEHGREPSPDFEKDAAVIAALSPRETPGTVRDFSGNNSVPELLARREALFERMKRDKAECEVAETELRYLMGNNERAEGVPGWSISYRVEPRKGYTVAASTPRILRIRRKDT